MINSVPANGKLPPELAIAQRARQKYRLASQKCDRLESQKCDRLESQKCDRLESQKCDRVLSQKCDVSPRVSERESRSVCEAHIAPPIFMDYLTNQKTPFSPIQYP
ncbi:hypothetical protein NIES39_A00160 [Arthrospira platensis NIES-39]|nr:hypothetical protein NIES39_A00160 [Arthrospira platensis NIES-39]